MNKEKLLGSLKKKARSVREPKIIRRMS